MLRTFRSLALGAVCALIALAPGSSAALSDSARPGSKIVYYLYATDGYTRLSDGSQVHIYGFAGGRAGEPITLHGDGQDDVGATRSMPEGAPPPSAGAVTEAEAALAGHAQLLAPLLWATADDVIEVRLKNLGAAGPGATAFPVGIEWRGLAPAGPGGGVPETSLLAIPANAALPDAGNVITYVFRVPSPGAYAYGWSYASHAAHGTAAADQKGSSSGSATVSCPCRALRMGGAPVSMAIGAASGSTAMGAADSLYPALDGALVIYESGDPAVRDGPGGGAGGRLLGLSYDYDLVTLVTGGLPSTVDDGAALMSGMEMTTPALDVMVNGIPPAELGRFVASPGVRPLYSLFVPQPAARTGRVLLRMINLSTLPQPLEAASYGYRLLAYRVRRLEWASPARTSATWARASATRPTADAAQLVVQPGDSVEAILDLGAPRG